MKKYIAPSVKVVNIQNETILAGSTLGTGTYSGEGQTLLSNRRGNFEEDEWE